MAKWRWISPGAALLCVLALAVSGWALFDRFQQANRNRADNAMAWHAAICYLEQLTFSNPDVTERQVERAIAAYDHILDLVHAAPCTPTRSN